MLGVAPEILASHGAVSLETAEAMAAGALDRSNALISIAITGIAGPTGGSPGKPVGTVCFAWARKGKGVRVETRRFRGDRDQVRHRCVQHALKGVFALVVK